MDLSKFNALHPTPLRRHCYVFVFIGLVILESIVPRILAASRAIKGKFPSVRPYVRPNVLKNVCPVPEAPAGRASEPAGRASKPAGRASEPAGRASEPAERAR